jgi:hypothetical protein
VGIASLGVPGLPAVRVPVGGPLRTRCGDVAIEAGGRRVALRPRGTVGDLLAGRPLRAATCSGDVRMGSGIQDVRSLRGAFSVDLLRLASRAPQPLSPAAGGGRVLDAGHLANTAVDGVRVALTGSSWLVLGESFNKGWEATCDGRSLGEPRPIDGYANGWRPPADCRDVAFAFAPQDGVRAGHVVSAVVCVLLLAFVLAGRVLHRRRPAPPRVPSRLPADATPRLSLPVAAGIALAATVPLSLLFALRTSVLIFPALTFILWRGVGPRVLTAVAAGLLGVVVPILYVVSKPENQGGYNFEYSLDTIRAHWVAVAALVLLMVACGRMLAAARLGRRAPEPLPTADRRPEAEHEPREGDLAGAGRPA